MSSKHGGVDRSHDRSIGAKLLFALFHGLVVVCCFWLALGEFQWPDVTRATILAYCALLYFVRHLVTLFVLLQRKVDLSEVFGLTLFMALFEIGFLLLGAGILAGEERPFGWLDWIGIGLLLAGSVLNTGSELQRWNWKKLPSSKGRCYTKGLFSYSMHINYFGDSILFTGWAILTASAYALAVPALITILFIFYHIPPLDAYLADRYGDEFKEYAEKTRKFVPWVY